MIKDAKQIKPGIQIINKYPHFTQVLTVTEVTKDYVYFSPNGVMPVSFFLNKHNFKIKETVK